MQIIDHFRKASWALTALVLLLGATARGQIITSTILGHVIDSSGAVVPGAEIAITNQGTSVTSRTRTNSVGDYSLSGLEAGVYTVSVTQKGFETSQTTGVQLTNQATQRVDVTLSVGLSTQMITVTGEKVSMVHTDSVTVGTRFNNMQLAEIPLQNDTIDSLDKMIPGYMFGQILSNSRVNGGVYIGSLNYTMNGAETNDQANGGQPYGHNTYAAALPTPESMQEYRVDTINTNADYARSTTISMLTRNGTNQFHGDFEELNANAALAANAFTYDGTVVNSATGATEPKPGYNRNQFQGNIGGPIKRDRIWFFGNFSYYDERAYTGESLDIPTAAMQKGNFGGLCTSGVFGANGICTGGTQLYNPANGQPYAGNVIPASSFTSQSNTLLNYLPAPNIKFVNTNGVDITGTPSGANDFLTQNRTAHDIDVTNDRVDFKLSNSDLLYATYMRAGATAYLEANAYPQSYGQDVYPPTNTQVTVAETHTFSPTMVNEFRASWFDRTVVEAGINLGFNPDTLFPTLQNTYNRGLPTMNMTGYTGMFHDVGNLPHAHVPAVEFTDNLTKVHGRHTLKFGVDELGIKAYGKPQPGGLGTFTFTGHWTGGNGWSGAPGFVGKANSGNAFADFLLGDTSGTNYVPPSTFGNNVYNRILGFYAQDTWQATSRLTIYYGLRYEYQLPWGYQTDGGVGIDEYFNPPTDQIALPENSSTPFFPPVNASLTQYNAYLPQLTTTQALGLKQQWETPDKTNFAPRLGFAYRPFHNNNTVIRAAYGVYYDQVSAGIYEGAYSSPPWLSNAAGSGLAFTSNQTASSGYQPDLTFSNPFPGAGSYTAPPNPTVTYIDKNFVRTAVQQWNVTLEHQFPGQWLGTMTYFGSQTHHIPWYNNDIDVPVTMSNVSKDQLELPYQPFAAVDSFRSGGKSNFEELQIQMQKRFSGGLSVQSYYVYAHSLDNVEGNSDATEPPDWHNPNADYGNTTFQRRQSFNIAYLYQLPFGQGKHFMGSAHGVVNAIVGGWEWSGDTTYGSGIPFTVMFTVPSTSANTGWLGYSGSTVAVANRANLVPGVPIYNRSHSHNIIPSGTYGGVPWFNQNAFTAPAPFTWGDSSRDAYFGPGWGDWDMALLKNFNIPGRENMKLQFRIEANNIWNHYNTGTPGTSSSAFGGYTLLAAPQYGGLAPAVTQGLISTVGGCYPNCTFGGPYGQGNRYFQVGARLFF